MIVPQGPLRIRIAEPERSRFLEAGRELARRRPHLGAPDVVAAEFVDAHEAGATLRPDGTAAVVWNVETFLRMVAALELRAAQRGPVDG